MNLSELLDKLGTARKEAADTYKFYKEQKQVEDDLRSELLITLREIGLKSAKNKDFTVSIAETPTIVIRDEHAVMEWLQNTPNVESDFYIGIKKTEFNTLAKQMLKETGELANGTEVEFREALSIRASKSNKGEV